MSLKVHQRREMLRVREDFVTALTPADLDTLGDRLIQNFYMWFKEYEIQSVGAYWSMPLEAPTQGLLESLEARGIVVGLPRLEGGKIVYHVWQKGQALLKSPYGFLAPAPTAPILIPDLCVTPLVAFDCKGHRLGYGKGHFDRFLESHPHVRTVGWAFDCQEVPEIHKEAHDQALTGVITPTRVLKFSEF
jgi:5-formyltetrahydrofolate cyclo-ligase